MYTISCVIGVRPVLIRSDHRPGAALDNRTGGGGSQYRRIYILGLGSQKKYHNVKHSENAQSV